MRLSCIVLFLGSYHPVNDNRNQRQKESIRDQLGFQLFNYCAANLGFCFPGWLAKQQTLSRGQLRKPTISLRPNHEIFLGEQLSIYCHSPHWDTKVFYLQKEGNQQARNLQATLLNEGIFTISSAQQTDVGKYWCWYCIAYYGCSSVSDVLYLNLTEVAYPKPSISVNPSEVVTLGESVSIHCKKEGLQTASFPLQKCLYKLLDTYKTIETKMGENEFPITKVEYEDAGIYRCRYCSQSESAFYQRCSNYSDQVYIIVTEVAYPKPSISVNPSEVVTRGESVSIHCKKEGLQTASFTLQKNLYKLLDTYETIETKMGENEFPITKVKSTDAGIYRCRYCSQSESAFYQRCSNYSDQVYINVTGYWHSKPFIQLTPSEEISPGSNVTIECYGPYNGLTFLLLKSNQVTASKETGQGRNSTKFHLSRVTSGDAGNYTCHYYFRNEFLWSVPSDPVELLLRGEPKIPISTWASIAAGLLLLVLLLLLIAVALHRKRKKRSTVKGSAQPMSMVTDFPPTEPDMKTEPDEVSYAVLNHNSLKTKRTVDTGQVSESCTYATLAQNQRGE